MSEGFFHMFLPSLCLSLSGPRNGPYLRAVHGYSSLTHTHSYLRVCLHIIHTKCINASLPALQRHAVGWRCGLTLRKHGEDVRVAVRDRCGAAGKECVGFWPLVEERVDVSQILNLSVVMASELHSCDVCSYVTARYAKSCFICKKQSCELSTLLITPSEKSPTCRYLVLLKTKAALLKQWRYLHTQFFLFFVLVLTASAFDE